MKESTLQQLICEYMSAKGIFYFSPLNETAMMIMKIFKIPQNIMNKIINFLKKMGLVPGMPDLAILANGTIYFMELKVEGNTLNDNQKIIIPILIGKGYDVAVIYNFEQAVEQLKMWGI